jgi:tetratricopeptide (TPR) repeat protein
LKISEGPALIETLPAPLQHALNSALGEERALITMRCRDRKAFAATATRLFVLTEPLITGAGPVDVQTLALSDVRNVEAQPRPVGGRLRWETDVAGAPAFVEYATYEGARFEVAAFRLRELLGESRPASDGANPMAETASSNALTCPKCRLPVPEGGCWCSRCGLQLADPCWDCGKPLPEGANHCAFCGTPNTEPAVLICGACQATVARGMAYCPGCGTLARPACRTCDRPMRWDWKRCPVCSGEPLHPGVAREEVDLPQRPMAAVSVAESLHPEEADPEKINQLGVKAYEAEDLETAIRRFREATDLAPRETRFWLNLAVALGELGKEAEALQAYRTLLDLDPRHVQGHLNLGFLYNEQERTSEARDAWERVIQIAPNSEEAREARENLDHMDQV